MARHVLIKDLNDSTDRWSILVRVFRKWNVYQKNATNTDRANSNMLCISMLLFDEEGTKIQASVMNRNMHDRFRTSIIEGRTYFMANFVVSDNLNQYRATSHPFKITITPQTYITDHEAAIKPYSYSFFPIPEILKATPAHHVLFLIDVIAIVKSMGTLEEFHRDDETKTKLRMVLTDSEENDVECVLYDQCASDAYMAYLQNTESPVVAVFNLARIGFSEDGAPTVCSSFSATRVHFNLAIKEVRELTESLKDGPSPLMYSYTQQLPSQSSQTTNMNSLYSQPKITISNIPQQAVGDSFVISCQIQKLETRYGWVYDGCSKCGTKPRIENSTQICGTCKKKVDFMEPKLRVHYLVKDQTGTASVIFWDKQAVQLVENTATEMKRILQQKKKAFEFPDDLDKPVGKKLLIKLKLNEYNKNHPSSSISVGQFTYCEDLMDQFEQVTSQTQSQPTEDMTQVSQPTVQLVDSQDNADSVAPIIHVPIPPAMAVDNDIRLCDISNPMIHTPVKGKRRYSSKKSAVKNGESTSQDLPMKIAEERVNKVIKKEK
ncbi:uncharacterized protein LOC114745433 [Neltuma alba]|uniref:uncharacterized protein LOC114745433 n=1 Tax=Neltuma alba TaxID=207710 RepID=UPI0010A4C9E1|nr:uncharacterized protein LOC114745433 [Prosopis alba]